MAWRLEFEKAAEADLASLDRLLRRRIGEKLDWLLENIEKTVPFHLVVRGRDF